MTGYSTEKQAEKLSSWWSLGKADHLFRRIQRYTRFVALSKWSLITIALLLTASLIIWPLLSEDASGVRISFVDRNAVGNMPAASPVMSNPEYRSVGDSGQEFKISGKTATQKTARLVEIIDAQAQMTKASGKWYSLSADRAEYDQALKRIELYGNVVLVDEVGANLNTERATIEVSPLHIYGDEAIDGETARGNILASGFEIVDDGQHIIFTRGDAPVKVTF